MAETKIMYTYTGLSTLTSCFWWHAKSAHTAFRASPSQHVLMCKQKEKWKKKVQSHSVSVTVQVEQRSEAYVAHNIVLTKSNTVLLVHICMSCWHICFNLDWKVAQLHANAIAYLQTFKKGAMQHCPSHFFCGYECYLFGWKLRFELLRIKWQS